MTKGQWLVFLGTAFLGQQMVHAQGDSYPNHAIKGMVPYLAGTGPDMSARVVAQEMGAVLKQPVIVENKAGAGSNLGAQIVARAPGDGYTWLYSGTPMAANMRIYRAPGFDALNDFVHVGRVTRSDSVIIVNADSEITSVKDLLDRLRKSPGKFFYASGGVGAPSHLGAELLLADTCTQAFHVPFKGHLSPPMQWRANRSNSR